jgi:hypothetical protein
MARPARVPARKILDFASVLGGRHLVNVRATPALDPILLSLEQPPDDRIVTDHGSFPKKRADRPNAFRVHHLAGVEWQALDLEETAENYHDVQPLPCGQWLLVRSRCHGEHDRNAHVYGPDGKPRSAFHAGDGIEDVQVTASGQVWVSYFDEGVCGETKLGRSGLACLDRRGRPVFRFNELDDAELVRSMADCYALNVTSDRETWLYYYVDFPLVRLLDCELAGAWPMPVVGSHGFAVDWGRVLLGGSYERPRSLFPGDLNGGAFRELRPVDEGGRPLGQFWSFGRGRLLFLATKRTLYVVDLCSL